MFTADTLATITTAKGTRTETLQEVCAWQARTQAAFASIEVDGVTVAVDGVDFDADDIDDAVEEVIRLLCRAAERAAAERAEQRADAFRAALGAATPADDDGEILGGEYHQYNVR